MPMVYSRRYVIKLVACMTSAPIWPADARETKAALTELEAAVQRSKRIVLARCMESITREVPQYGGSPFTFYRFESQRVLRGDPMKQFSLRIFGGRVGDTELASEHIPTFVPQRRYLLFLGENNRDGFPVVSPGWVFEVVADPNTKVEHVTPLAGFMYQQRELDAFMTDIESIVKKR